MNSVGRHNRGLKVNGKEGKSMSVECLQRFRNAVSLHLLSKIVETEDKRRDQGNEDAVMGSVGWLTQLDACIATFVTCIVESAQWAYFQKQYAGTYGKIIKLPLKHVTGNIKTFVE